MSLYNGMKVVRRGVDVGSDHQAQKPFWILATEPPDSIDNNDVNNILDFVKDTYDKTSKYCLGFKTSRAKWLIPLVMLRNKYKDDYRTASKEVKKLAKIDKRLYIEDIAAQAAEKKEQDQLYKLTNLVSGKYRGNINIPGKYKMVNFLLQGVDKKHDGQNTFWKYLTDRYLIK